MPQAIAPDPDRLRAANINPATGLATDYLNQYNGVTIAIASLGDLPDSHEQVLAWRPVGYAAQLRMSGFREHDLALASFEAVPAAVRTRFLTARREVELAIIEVQELIEAAPQAAAGLAARAPDIFNAIARLSGVINGDPDTALPVRSRVDSPFP